MNKTTDTVPGDSNFSTAWNTITQPFRIIWNAAKILLQATMRGARTSPMISTAILVAAGLVSFLAKSHHVGTIFISAVGVLWMWQDMLDDNVRAAHEAAVPVVA